MAKTDRQSEEVTTPESIRARSKGRDEREKAATTARHAEEDRAAKSAAGLASLGEDDGSESVAAYFAAVAPSPEEMQLLSMVGGGFFG